MIYDRDVEGGYLREYDMLGGVGFLCAWERVKVSGGIASVEVDWRAFEDFCSALVASGKIAPPGDTVITRLRDAATRSIRLCEPRKERPSVAAEMTVYANQIKACDALEALAGA